MLQTHEIGDRTATSPPIVRLLTAPHTLLHYAVQTIIGDDKRKYNTETRGWDILSPHISATTDRNIDVAGLSTKDSILLHVLAKPKGESQQKNSKVPAFESLYITVWPPREQAGTSTIIPPPSRKGRVVNGHATKASNK